MKKKIMQTFAVLICAYALLTLFSLFNLRSVEGMLRQSSTIDTEFYRSILELSNQVKALQESVAKSFVLSSPEKIDETINDIKDEFIIITAQLEHIQDEEFTKILSNHLDSNRSTKEDSDKDETVGDLVKFLESDVEKLKEFSLSVVENTKEILSTEKSLNEEHKKLSNTFRKINFLPFLIVKDSDKAKIHLNNLTRSIMVVMYSKSVDNLNTMGKSKFDSATKFWDKKLNRNIQYKKFKDYYDSSYRLATKKAKNTSTEAYFKFNQSSFEFIKGIKKLTTFSEELFSDTQENILSDVVFTNKISTIASLLVLIFGTLFAWITLNRLTESLRKIIARVTNESGSVAGIASKVKSSADTLSESVARQGSAIQETVSSMQEISSMISKTTDQSKTANDETRRLVGSMEELKETNRNLKQLELTFKTIETKTKVINDIVFKTQLLSFNASIEAARAGTHGKGFAVVAQEVGKLADLSGSAAEEINNLLSESDSQIKDTVENTSDRIERFESALNKVSNATESITQASHEQENGVHQTNSAMDQMDGATQENSENAEELLQISGNLQDNSQNLQNATTDLNKIVAGKKWVQNQKKGVLSKITSSLSVKDKKSKTSKQLVEESEIIEKDFTPKPSADIDGDDDSFKPAV